MKKAQREARARRKAFEGGEKPKLKWGDEGEFKINVAKSIAKGINSK